MKKKFSEVYYLYCETIEKSTQEKLGRPLTEAEQYSIWNAGSLLMLEALERDIARSQSIEEVITLLARPTTCARCTAFRHRHSGLGRLIETVQFP